jgi:hypothetical protein
MDSVTLTTPARDRRSLRWSGLHGEPGGPDLNHSAAAAIFGWQAQLVMVSSVKLSAFIAAYRGGHH